LSDNIKSPKLQFVQNPPKLRHHKKSAQRKNVRKAGSVVKPGSVFKHCQANDRLIFDSPITVSSPRFGVLWYNLIRRAKTNALVALSLGVGFAQNFAYTEVEMVATGETSDSREVQ
jgi:hypothetical protein